VLARIGRSDDAVRDSGNSIKTITVKVPNVGPISAKPSPLLRAAS